MTRRGRPPHPDVLTPAEWGVLDGVRDGLTNAEIAERLGVSVNTVRYHVSNMLTKVGVTDRQALAAWEGVPVTGVRFTRGGLFAVARVLGLAGAVFVLGVLAWIALDRLQGGGVSEVPASVNVEASATPSEATPVATIDPLARDVPFVTDGQLWARALVGNGSTGLSSPDVAVRPDGTILFVANMGTYETPIVEAGGAPLPAAGRGDIVMAALTSDGAHLWSRLIGGPGDDYAVDIAVMEAGSFVLSGTFEEGMDFGAGPVSSEGTHPPGSSGARDAFIARFDSTGDLEGVQTFGWEDRDGGSVGILPGGDIVASVSSSASELQLGTYSLESEDDELSVVIRLSPAGDVVWARAISATSGLSTLKTDPDGQIVFATREWAEIPGGRTTGVSGLMKLSSDDGEPIWRTEFEGVALGAVGVEVGPDGSILLRGAFFRGPVDFGGGVMGTDERQDGLVARFSADGDFEWALPREEGVEALAVDESGDIWLAGGSANRVDESYIERLDPGGRSEGYLPLGPEQAEPQWGPELNQQTGGHRIDRLAP